MAAHKSFSLMDFMVGLWAEKRKARFVVGPPEPHLSGSRLDNAIEVRPNARRNSRPRMGSSHRTYRVSCAKPID